MGQKARRICSLLQGAVMFVAFYVDFDIFGRHFHEVGAFWLDFDTFGRYFQEVGAFWMDFNVLVCHFHNIAAFLTYFYVFGCHFHEVDAFRIDADVFGCHFHEVVALWDAWVARMYPPEQLESILRRAYLEAIEMRSLFKYVSMTTSSPLYCSGVPRVLR